MMHKVTVQEERTKYGDSRIGEERNPIKYFETTAEVTSDYPTVVAGFLRALADKLDPPKVSF